MEDVSWIFNSDFEQRLFEQRFHHIHSNKNTQEFEYFIHLLDPNLTIFTNKKYSDEYNEFILKLSGAELKTTSKSSLIINWCGDYTQLELKSKFQNKAILAKTLKDQGLIKSTPEIITETNKLEDGFLYKYPKSLSGGGHYFFPRDKPRLHKLLRQNEPLIKEKIYKRFLDFSALVESGVQIGLYQNIIDDYFQYKGTIVDDEFSLGEFADEYEFVVSKIRDLSKDYLGVFSIDSFLYLEAGEKKLYPACEMNMRKTMGYTALKFKEKYFKGNSKIKMILVRNTLKDFSYLRLEESFGSNVLLISPTDNRFLVFIITGNNMTEINERESQLSSTFLKRL